MTKTLGELAKHINAELIGDANCEITGVATLQSACDGQLSFLANSTYRQYLADTKASAVIVSKSDADACPQAALIVNDPYYAYARVAALFAKVAAVVPGIHGTVVVGENCHIDPTARIDAYVVMGDRVSIGPRTHIYSGCAIGNDVQLGASCCVYSNVNIYDKTQIGDRVIIHSGVVIGSDGFGFANHEHRWHKVPQLGHVIVGDDVDIGANTTIDCGALDDTIIETGVKLDNQIQVGHNVRIGAHTVVAGCTGIAGSTKIGRGCIIGGAAMIAGHLELTDGVVLTGGAMITNSIRTPGIYSSGTSFMEHRAWQKNVARFRHLDELTRRVKALEEQEKNHE
ncbi:MAG: UDP-3-O-(3-hydroxymyristoyl)glucosamine N-acyltransferase [Gammaproteobacteria bacterium RIFCSPHIGHO2_02_FULL_42_13]|nr:MAG: UDP-3-O-(3-hydroxymyristoyl)glucosamine N-acyltransferase [Gammaproteobacteria bacterium RIFCSPHIGHO2_02_FULL_42_13]